MGYFRKMPIRYQLLTVAVLSISIMVFIIYITYSQVSNVIVKKNREYTKEIITQVKESVSINCNQVSMIAVNLSYNIAIQEFLNETDIVEKYQLSIPIDMLFNNINSFKEGIIDIVILGQNGNSYSMNGRTALIRQIQHEFNGKRSPYFTGIKYYEDFSVKKKCIISGMEIYSIDPQKVSDMPIGILAIVLDPNLLSPKMEKNTRDATKFFIFDREHNIFASNDKLTFQDKSYTEKVSNSIFEGSTDEGLYTKFINGKRSIVQLEKIDETGGMIASLTPEESLFVEIRDIRIRILIIFTFAMFLVSIPFVFAINNILVPIRKFMMFMISIKSGNLKSLKKRIYLEGYSEMSVMAGEFNGMLDEIDSLTHRLVETSTRLYKAEVEKKQSELAFLQSQINPHFLYNTLESIKCIAAIRGVNEIRDISKALSQIFRYSIKGADEVTLDEEISIVKSYIQIHQIRFKDRFYINYNFSQEALECIIPKMILQPLAENAIYHGLEPKTTNGNLYISGTINEKSELVIIFKDDGVGMDKFVLDGLREKLNSSVHNDLTKNGTGIGLVNVNNRLKLTFGDNCGIMINSDIGIGTEVVVVLLARR